MEPETILINFLYSITLKYIGLFTLGMELLPTYDVTSYIGHLENDSPSYAEFPNVDACPYTIFLKSHFLKSPAISSEKP